jgi:HemY protein
VIRLASWIVLSLLITAAIAWLTSLPGTMTIELLGYRLQPRLGVAAFILLGLFVAAIIVWGIVRRIVTAPRFLAKRADLKRKEQGVEALSDGYIALEAGDYGRARMLAREARTNLPRNEAAQLLEARADLALGDMSAAREHYRALISNRKTALAALSGLYEQARQQTRPEVALTFAKKAMLIAPDAGWANAAVFEDLGKRGQWTDALAMVSAEPALTREEKLRKRRRQAVLETALAREVEGTDPLAALDHALTALKLVPEFVPAALIAARIHSDRGEGRRAMSLLRRVWRATRHPDLATLYANAVPGVSAVERLRRLRELIEIPAPDRASAVVLARAAVEAYEWATARNALAAHLGNPSQAVCLLLAEIEEGQNGDQGKAREWLARAVRAPRDAAWTADGIVFPEWVPVSPASGRLDALHWRVPPEAPGAARPEPLRPVADTTALVVAESENPALAPPGPRQ